MSKKLTPEEVLEAEIRAHAEAEAAKAIEETPEVAPVELDPPA
jgi:hypothetical protein